MKSKRRTRKRTVIRDLSETLGDFVVKLARMALIMVLCMWVAVNVKVEYNGARVAQQVEKASKGWMGKTAENLKGFFDIVKAVQ